MKRLFYVAVTALACFAAYQAVAHNHAGEKRDLRREAALAGNDLAAFLHYNPTDGASHAGKVRKAMDPSHVQP